MEKKFVPKTKVDWFSLLDKELSNEDKQAIVEMDDLSDLHFSLGIWIRNNYLYHLSFDEKMDLLKEFGLDNIFCHTDGLSSTIIEAYQDYLKNGVKPRYEQIK
jgi:hypothetical protein